MRLIITRPLYDAKATAAQLEKLGHEGIPAPLLEISAIADASIPNESWQAVLVSSANAVRALEELGLAEKLHKIPLLAVGEASAAAARSAGFELVESANGDLPALVETATRRLDPESGPLLYLSGKVVSGDLKGQLEERGFTVQREEIYAANAVEKMPAAASAALAQRDVDGVGLFSRRSARIWLSFLSMPGYLELAFDVIHFCLSQAVADEIMENWPSKRRRPRIIVSKSADMAGFLSSLSDTA